MSQANIAYVFSQSVEGKRLVSTSEGILVAHSMACHNFSKFSGKNIKWWITQYEKFCVQYFIQQEDMIFNVRQFLSEKPAKWHDMVLEFDSWDGWKSMAIKHFGNTHMDIVKKLEMIHIQDYETIEKFIDAYHALARLLIQQKVQKRHQSSKSDIEHDFNSGIGLTFFKRTVPLVYCMAIEERDIENLSEAYDLVEKLFCIKVENFTDKKARQESE
ncbi:hypothetical protein DSO57_1015822 [Entomophthora muscae]|uniref:Uncharacterized protein n=1 Tax=Entomophthora muscae TaxID=34485 RepID=A0ACC2STS8_9FUNG|nr:hypothetical protein DSO57_1015822 [Entomophthora muscae]